jgi:hypothetical protein
VAAKGKVSLKKVGGAETAGEWAEEWGGRRGRGCSGAAGSVAVEGERGTKAVGAQQGM